ncbi:MAG: hypothetical protein CM15mP55_1530 [Hyphomicrobiales bacterium]|nr:MAG: hypothetical protein CM15mP55_1530 [Hyphomicrobiales bacterium]
MSSASIISRRWASFPHAHRHHPAGSGRAGLHFRSMLADLMIGDNTDNVHMQGVGLAAVNQVDRQWSNFGHHNQRARPVRASTIFQFIWNFWPRARIFVQRRAIQLILRAQSDTHEKHATFGVAELLAFVNIQPRLAKICDTAATIPRPSRQERVTINFCIAKILFGFVAIRETFADFVNQMRQAGGRRIFGFAPGRKAPRQRRQVDIRVGVEKKRKRQARLV